MNLLYCCLSSTFQGNVTPYLLRDLIVEKADHGQIARAVPSPGLAEGVRLTSLTAEGNAALPVK